MVESRVADEEEAGQSAIIKMYVGEFGPLVLRQRQADWKMQSSSFPEQEPFIRHIAVPSLMEKYPTLMTFGHPT